MDNKRFISKVLSGTRLYFCVIAAFVLLAFLSGNYYLAGCELVIGIVLAVYYLFNHHAKQQQILQYIENLTFHLDNATKDSMVRFPLPLTVLDLTGNIVWHNKKFADAAGETAFEKHISEIAPEIEILKILENRNNIDLQIGLNGRTYNVIGNVVEFMNKQNKSYSLVLYWIDRTAEAQAVKQYNDYRVLSCSVLVDNYDDISKNLTQTNNSAVYSAIEQSVRSWVNAHHGIVKKLEKDRYYVVFENKDVQELIEQKFEILDQVKKIDEGNTIPVTLSIGIGDGQTIQQSEDFAKTSLDMALGRGGDQVVIKSGEGFRFFGGRTEGKEKHTRVKSRVVAYALRELLDQASEVFITGHKHADADSFGAAVALYRMAKNRGVPVHIVIDEVQSTTDRLMRELLQSEDYKDAFINEGNALQLYTANSLLIVVDTHNPGYVEAEHLLDVVENKVLIDHHRRGEHYIDKPVLTFHEPYASSTCEMVTEIFQYIENSPRLTAKEAQAVYAGIVLDTKNFSVKTGVRTFDAAAFLRRMGVDTTAVKKTFQNDLSLYIKRAKIISNAEKYDDCIAISTWDENEQQANILTAQAADELLNISEIAASFVLCKSGDTIVISGRSLGSYNVQVVMEQLGGGGHMTVAGAQLQNLSMNEAVDRLKHAIDETEQ